MKISVEQLLVVAAVATSLYAAADGQYLWSAYFTFYAFDKFITLKQA